MKEILLEMISNVKKLKKYPCVPATEKALMCRLFNVNIRTIALAWFLSS